MRSVYLFLLSTLSTLILSAQIPQELKPSSDIENDLSSSKNLLQLKTGFNGNLELEEGIKEYKGTSRYAIGYERRLSNKILNNWWSFKTDTRVNKISSGKMESRVMLIHGRELNDFIKMKSNWGLGYGSGFHPTYMMGLTFNLTKQWRLFPSGRPFLPKSSQRSANQREKL